MFDGLLLGGHMTMQRRHRVSGVGLANNDPGAVPGVGPTTGVRLRTNKKLNYALRACVDELSRMNRYGLRSEQESLRS